MSGWSRLCDWQQQCVEPASLPRCQAPLPPFLCLPYTTSLSHSAHCWTLHSTLDSTSSPVSDPAGRVVLFLPFFPPFCNNNSSSSHEVCQRVRVSVCARMRVCEDLAASKLTKQLLVFAFSGIQIIILLSSFLPFFLFSFLCSLMDNWGEGLSLMEVNLFPSRSATHGLKVHNWKIKMKVVVLVFRHTCSLLWGQICCCCCCECVNGCDTARMECVYAVHNCVACCIYLSQWMNNGPCDGPQRRSYLSLFMWRNSRIKFLCRAAQKGRGGGRRGVGWGWGGSVPPTFCSTMSEERERGRESKRGQEKEGTRKQEHLQL